jgi:signal transduction histidine kinase
VLVLCVMWSYRNTRVLARHQDMVVHTHEVLDALHDTLAALTDAETGERGYIITGEASYLEPFNAALKTLQAKQSRVKELTADNSSQQLRVAALAPMTSVRLATLTAGIAARDEKGAEGGRRFVLIGKEKGEMDAIRGVLAEMEREERGLLADREREVKSSFAAAIITLIATAVLGLSFIGATWFVTAREVATRRRTADLLRQANEALEQKVQERTTELNEAVQSLRHSNRELEQFASVASHDLQEPLRKIQAFGDRLQEKCSEGLGDQGRQYVDRMQAAATRMRSLIDAILSYSRITTKAQPFVPVDLGLTAREVLSDLEGRLSQTGGRVDIGRLPTVDADPMQMRQLLQNLIGNALKFHRPGEAPVVAVESRLLSAEGDGPRAARRYEVSVRDNGIGFEETYLDRIFDVFQRLHGRQEYEGTGMGLAICRRIVERHGGSITATSAPDKGAAFMFTLPSQHHEEKP